MSLQQAWYADARWPLLLTPLEWLYRRLASSDQAKKRAQQWQAPVPLMVVGNITVGGTGKSPLVCTLVHELKQRGWQPGIVSRGYGGQSKHYPLLVDENSDPVQAGDEPVMLAGQTGCPVVVDPNRTAAAQYLLQQTEVNLIISDDGLQHLSLGRDLELVVIDAQRGLGNGHCLPVGPLREPADRLHTVDYIFANGAVDGSAISTICDAVPGTATAKALGPVKNLKGNVQAMTLQPVQWRQPATGQCFDISERPFDVSVKAVAGIGHPERFFSSLRELGLTVEGEGFADHHRFKAGDITDDGRPVLMTAKDAVKCRHWMTPNHWVLDVSARIAPELIEAINEQLLKIQKEKK
ncbi:tetraacyldisaccharide 4'-kinase [Oceanospirillum beijerinckii]|uniref:tetraacyldisaccharide 4'-kinase n=1 Tax=Oceanospirillum beijerinckii TaxID=64976 RepID=UPI000418C81E|nr:tetraacyldisaccharide 4'-kinase [Oceanospirillum beijerinckii]